MALKIYDTMVPQGNYPAVNNGDVAPYYHTEREEVGKSHSEINTEYIYSLYEALVEQYPGKITKTPLGTVTYTTNGVAQSFEIREYVISTGEYTTGYYSNLFGHDERIKKPKYLIISGTHGRERKTVFSAYKFVKDLLSGHNVPKEFREGAIVHIIPIANPSSFDDYTRWNRNRVDINRNFPHGGAWVPTDYDYDFDGQKDDYTNGASAASEQETQIIINWLNANKDANLFVELHNMSETCNISCIFGAPNNSRVDEVKKIAMRGIDRVIPFWRDVMQYPKTLEVLRAVGYNQDGSLITGEVEMPVVFAYCVTANDTLKSSLCVYAANMVGIPGITVELSTYYGDQKEWEDDEKAGTYLKAYHPESIASGAEVLGNILIESYEQADMEVPTGVPIYNGEAVFHVDTTTYGQYKTYAKYNGEVE